MGVTNLGKAAVAALTGAGYTFLAYGTGTTAFSAAQTTLVTQSQIAAATVAAATTTVANDTAQLTKSFSISGTEVITEVGIFSAASAGTMLCRTVLTASRSVVSGDTYALSYKVAVA